MLTSQQELVDKLAAAIAAINEVVADLQGESPFAVTVNTREKVIAIVSQGLCLNGGHEIPKGMKVVRGMCRECYNAAKAAGFRDYTLITLGLMSTEKSKGGRPRKLRESPLRNLIEGKPVDAKPDAKSHEAKAIRLAKEKDMVDDDGKGANASDQTSQRSSLTSPQSE